MMLRFIHKISSTRKNCHFILYSSHLNKIQILLFKSIQGFVLCQVYWGFGRNMNTDMYCSRIFPNILDISFASYLNN